MQYPFYIGTFAGNNPNYNDLNYNSHGKTDDIKIYRCALSNEEIAELYTPADTTTCIVLQPNAEDGKDARIHSLGTYTFGTTTEFESMAWTYSGTPDKERSLLRFNIDTIPDGAIITSAKLLLFDSQHPIDSHSNISGSNANVLQRIVSQWSGNNVSWEKSTFNHRR
jgi:hypothetical protein